MSADKENDQPLVSTGGSIEKLRPGSKQIMDGMVEDFSKQITSVDASKKIDKLLSALGWVYWLKSEKFFNPLTAISGSGPAYIFLFLQEIRLSNKALKYHLSDMDSMKKDL